MQTQLVLVRTVTYQLYALQAQKQDAHIYLQTTEIHFLSNGNYQLGKGSYLWVILYEPLLLLPATKKAAGYIS